MGLSALADIVSVVSRYIKCGEYEQQIVFSREERHMHPRIPNVSPARLTWTCRVPKRDRPELHRPLLRRSRRRRFCLQIGGRSSAVVFIDKARGGVHQGTRTFVKSDLD